MESGPTEHFRALSALSGPKATSIALPYFYPSNIICRSLPAALPPWSTLLTRTSSTDHITPALQQPHRLSAKTSMETWLRTLKAIQELVWAPWGPSPALEVSPSLTSGTSNQFWFSNPVWNPSLQQQAFSLQSLVLMLTYGFCPVLICHLFNFKYHLKKPQPRECILFLNGCITENTQTLVM